MVRFFSSFLAIVLSILLLHSCSDVRINNHEEWKSVFDKHQIKEACFEFYDNNKETANYFNKERCSQRMTPASTFKIFNSLVALETGVAQDEQLLIKWDGQKREFDNWNQDLTMTQAFKYSAVPYYQELARRIGLTEMKKYIDTVQYGNRNISGALDQFWLNDSLQISPDEQVGLMKRLYHDELPFSARSQRIVKGMMLQEEVPDYKLYYKTGWGVDRHNKRILWVVGFAEKINRLTNPKTKQVQPIPHPYFFALNYELPDAERPNAAEERIQILHELLTEAGIHKY